MLPIPAKAAYAANPESIIRTGRMGIEDIIPVEIIVPPDMGSQRFKRVAGRIEFKLLVRKREIYREWVPGCADVGVIQQTCFIHPAIYYAPFYADVSFVAIVY